MTCREFADFLMGYTDGTLPEEQRAEFDRHLNTCPTCVDYMKSYTTTVELIRGLGDDPEGSPPEDAPEELIQAIIESSHKA